VSIKPQILVVDDEAGIRRALERVLKNDFEITFCENGLEAIDHLKSDQFFHLICTDLSMPLMDGYELIKAARDLPKYVHSPIVVISAWSETDSKHSVLKLGAVDLIPKPFDAVELFHKFKNLIDISQTLALVKEQPIRIFDKVVEDTDLFNSMIENEHQRSTRATSNLVLACFQIPNFHLLYNINLKNADLIRTMVGHVLLSAFRRPNDRLGYLGDGKFMIATSNLEPNFYNEYLYSVMFQISELGIHHIANPPTNIVDLVVGGVSIDSDINYKEMDRILIALSDELTKAQSLDSKISFRNLKSAIDLNPRLQ